MNKLALAAFAVLGAGLAEARAQTGDAPNSPATAIEAPGAIAMPADGRFGGIERFIDGYVAAAQADGYPPGLMIAVATPGGAFVKAYGVRDISTGEAATPDTLFRIASISKTFVWTSVMMLVDEGRVDLDADVNLYLKTVRIADAFGRPVTLNDLMAHRAGFEETFGDFFESRSGRSFEEALINQMPKRVAPPGLRTAYSNWGTDLAAQIVADVAGVPFDDFVRARILTPLAMTSTALRDPELAFGKKQNDPALDARMASPHKFEAGATVAMGHDALDPLNAAGAVSLSARDAARWIQFFLNEGAVGGERLLSPEAFALMRTRHFNDRPDAPDFAHGFMESTVAGHKAFGHGGTLSGFISDLTIVPDLGVGILVSVNGAEGASRLPDLLSRAIVEEMAGASPYASKWTGKGDKDAAAALAGTYFGARHVHSKFEKLTALDGDLTVAAREDGSIAIAAGGVTKRYYPLTKDLWTDRGDDAVFVYRDDNGVPVRLANRMGTDSAERIGFLKSSQAFNAALSLVVVFSMTAFVGLWRRLGREAPVTGAGRLLSLAHLAGAALWFVLAGFILAATVELGAKELAEIQALGWPPKSLVWTRAAAHLAALGGLASVALLVPALASSGWSIWRKIHFSLFALSGAFAAYQLWQWKLILAPMTRV